MLDPFSQKLDSDTPSLGPDDKHPEIMMGWYGVGSVSSPIVISDDEDESLVERALEDRLSDPQDGAEDMLEPFEYGDDEMAKPPLAAGSQMSDTLWVNGPIPGRERESKRKRVSEVPEAMPQQHVPKVALGFANSRKRLKLQQQQKQQSTKQQSGESKAARKKRRKRERMEAEVAAAIAATITPFSASQPILSGSLTPPLPPVPGSGRSEHGRNPQPSPPPLSVRTITQEYPLSPPPDMFKPPSPYPPLSHTYDQNQTFPAHPLPLPPMPPTHHPLPIPPLPGFPIPLMEPTFGPLSLMLQASLLHTMQNNLPSMDDEPEHPPQDILYKPQPLPQPSALPRNIVKKMIGMTADLDELKGHGIFTSASHSSPPVNRTLVMESLPKKFRTTEFVRLWTRRFGAVTHLELDPKIGKALIVFQDAKMAREAWASPRFHNGDGQEHIRVYWYRTPGAVFEEGEVEEWELENINKLKGKAMHAKLPSVPSVPSKQAGTRRTNVTLPSFQISVPGPSSQPWPTATSSGLKVHPSRRSNIPSLLPQDPSPSPAPSRSVAPPSTVVTQAQSPPRLNAVLCAEEAMDIASDNELDVELGHTAPPALDFPMRHTADDNVPIVSSRPGSPLRQDVAMPCAADAFATPASDSDSISSFKAMASVTSSSELRMSLLPASVPTSGLSTPAGSSSVIESAATTPLATPTPPPSEPRAMKSTDTRLSLLARQRELEERIARSRLEIAARNNASPSGTDLPDSVTTREKGQTSYTDTSSTVVPVVTATSATTSDSSEGRLRQLVLASKRTNTGASTPLRAEAPSFSFNGSLYSTPTKDPIPGSKSPGAQTISATAVELPLMSTAVLPPTSIDLDDLATSFITETIQAVSPFHSLPVRPTPVPPKPSEKGLLATKQAVLEKHIAESKLLMAKLGTAKTKVEKDGIMAELRASSRRTEEAIQTCSMPTPSNEAKRPMFRSRKSMWPEPKESCVLVISDDEDEE